MSMLFPSFFLMVLFSLFPCSMILGHVSRSYVMKNIVSSRVASSLVGSLSFQESSLASGNFPLSSRRWFSFDPSSLTFIQFPALSPTMETGKIASWLKEEGDVLEPGDVLCEIETDKATVSFEIQDDGMLAQILATDLSKEVAIGSTIAISVADESDFKAFKEAYPNGYPVEQQETPSSQQETPPSQQTPPSPTSPSTTSSNSDVRASPAAKHIASSHGIDLTQIQGTGKRGIIVKGDVLKAKNQTQSQPQSQTQTQTQTQPQAQAPSTPSDLDFEDIPLSMMRKVIAKRLLESKQTNPHSYACSSMQMDALMALRASINKRLASITPVEEGKKPPKVSVNDLLIKCCSKALARNPVFLQQPSLGVENAPIDISVAVSTDSGLITPIISDTASKSITDIHLAMKAMAGKARAGTLQPHEYSGGDFTISNLGMVKAISEFSAVINPPQHAILAVASTNRKPVIRGGSDGEEEETFDFGTFCEMTLSSNRAALNEVEVRKFMEDLKDIIENPLANLM